LGHSESVTVSRRNRFASPDGTASTLSVLSQLGFVLASAASGAIASDTAPDHAAAASFATVQATDDALARLLLAAGGSRLHSMRTSAKRRLAR